MAWTLEAKILPLVGVSGHLYLEVFDDAGKRVCQMNGLATNPKTNQPREIGLPGDKLKAYVDGVILSTTQGSDRDHHPHEGRVLFRGDEADVRRAAVAMRAAAKRINALDLPYQLLSLNSNSVFMNMVDAVSEVLPIDKKAVQEMTSMMLALPGVRNHITQADVEKVRRTKPPRPPGLG